MPKQKRKQPAIVETPSPPDRNRVVLGVLGLLVIVATLIFGRYALGSWTIRLAANAIDSGAVYDAEGWLDWGRWLGADPGRIDLLQAACHRHLDQLDQWLYSIEAAGHAGAPKAAIEQEIRLADTRRGKLNDQGNNPLADLIESGVPQHEVLSAYVHGFLRREEPERAKLILDGWSRNSPGNVHLLFMEAVVQRWLSQPALAEAKFRNVLGVQPRHDVARIVLAQMLEEQNRLDEALVHYAELASRAPSRANRQVDLARLLRKKGRYQLAREILQSALDLKPSAIPKVAKVELGQIELESGNYETAGPLLNNERLAGLNEVKRQLATATLFSVTGNPHRAEPIFSQMDSARSQSIRTHDLQVRLAVDPNDVEARREFASLLRPVATPPQPSSGKSSSALFIERCSACHGVAGDGRGPAARFLYPRPRNLRDDRFRLVSSFNTVPTLRDIQAVIQQGIPGTAMPANKDLSNEILDLLAREVQRMQHEGMQGRFRAEYLRDSLGAASEQQISEIMATMMTPGEIVTPPKFDLPDAAAIARGKQSFIEIGCHQCHGVDGVGSRELVLFDNEGQLSRPRDLVNELFKGGQHPESMYLRIKLGMPGTPHPACTTLSEQQLVDLVHYCRSLSREPKRVLTNREREAYRTTNAYREAYP